MGPLCRRAPVDRGKLQGLRVVRLLACAVLGVTLFLATAGVAGAYAPVPPSPLPPNMFRMGFCWNQRPISVPAGQPISVVFGWVSKQETQTLKFLDNQSGSVLVTDSSGATVTSYSWATGDTTYWSAPFASVLSTNGGNPAPVSQTTATVPLGTFASPGTYYLTFVGTLAKGVNDGFGAVPPGTYTTSGPGGSGTTPCAFTVT